MVRVVPVAFAILCVAATKVSAGQMEDVVYLENGGIVRGTILEQIPDKSLKIKRRDGREILTRITTIGGVSPGMCCSSEGLFGL